MSKSFCILRTAKLTSYGAIGASGEHTWRERPTPNADSNRTPNNEDMKPVHSSAALIAAVRERVELADRKANGGSRPVLAIEYLITASPEVMSCKTADQRRQYFVDALYWLETKHGRENVVAANIQRDETTEHLAAYVVPLIERPEKLRKRSVIAGKDANGNPIREARDFLTPGGLTLSACHFLDGRKKLSAMQTDFATTVGKRHGLERGIEGSKAKHQRVKRFYSAINAPVPQHTIAPEAVKARVVQKRLLGDERESTEDIAYRLTKQMQENYSFTVAQAAQTDAANQRANEMAKTATLINAELQSEREKNAELQSTFASLIELMQLSHEDAVIFLKSASQKVAHLKAQKDLATQEEQINLERQQRIDKLPEIERNSAGSAYIFARIALASLRNTADPTKINWQNIEQAAATEAIGEHQQDSNAVFSALAQHSPGLVTKEELEGARVMVDKTERLVTLQRVSASQHDDLSP